MPFCSHGNVQCLTQGHKALSWNAIFVLYCLLFFTISPWFIAYIVCIILILSDASQSCGILAMVVHDWYILFPWQHLIQHHRLHTNTVFVLYYLWSVLCQPMIHTSYNRWHFYVSMFYIITQHDATIVNFYRRTHFFLLFPCWNQMHADTFNLVSVRDTYILYTVKFTFIPYTWKYTKLYLLIRPPL